MTINRSSKIPIVIFIYKRDSNIKKIFETVRNYGPSRIYIIADGPKYGEADLTKAVRSHVEKSLDWDCTLHKVYSTKNIGLKRRFKSGLDEVFKSEQFAIILEDDCVPDQSFFNYCEELLYKYLNDDRIMTISGDNFQPDSNILNDSYYFSKYPHIWGWATWKRAWKLYDGDMELLEQSESKDKIRRFINNNLLYFHLMNIFKMVKNNFINTWDYQLVYSSLIHGKLHIMPSINLVENVGVDSLATHTKTKSEFLGRSKNNLPATLIHPQEVAVNQIMDRYTANHVYMNLKSFIGTLIRYVFYSAGIKI